MNRHLIFGLLLIGSLVLAGCGDKSNDSPKKVIGIVNLTPTVEVTIQGFKEELAENGYIEGDNVTYFYEGPVKKLEALDGAIQNVLKQHPDLILSLLTPVSKKMKAATVESQIPIVFGPVGDPVSAGIVRNLKEPGENLTGIRVSGTGYKTLEWFLRIVPGLDTLLVPYNPNETAMRIGLKTLKKVANELKVDLVVREVQSGKDLENAFTGIPPEVDGVWTLGSGFWAPFVDDYIKLTIDHQLPMKGTTAEWCKRGALFSFSEDLHRLGKQQARMAMAILSGSSTPKDLPVEQADFYLTLNPDTAKSINLNLPDTMLKLADFIVKTNAGIPKE